MTKTPTKAESLAARAETLAIAEALERRVGCSALVLKADIGRAAAELRCLSAENTAAVSAFLAADDERRELRAERDALRAELDELYRLRAAPTEQAQEPVAWQSVGGSIWAHKTREDDRPLYAAPVEQAQGSDSISDAFKAGMAAMEYAIWEGKEPCPCRKQAAQAVPAGFKLVPVEPTEDMLTAASLADDKAFVDGSAHGATAEDIWAAMLSAAPTEQAARTSPAHQPVHGWTDADADAARLALELECLLTDKDIPTATVSRWWDSAHEALALHRQRLASDQAHGIGATTGEQR